LFYLDIVNKILSLVLISSVIIFGSKSFALDLEEIYDLSLRHSYAIKAAKNNYLAELQTLSEIETLKKPAVSVHARIGASRYQSDVPSVEFKNVTDVQACSQFNVWTFFEDVQSCYDNISQSIQVKEKTKSDFIAQEIGVVVSQSIYDASISEYQKQAVLLNKRSSILLYQSYSDLMFDIVEAYVLAIQSADMLKKMEKQTKLAKSRFNYIVAQLQNGVGVMSDVYELKSLAVAREDKIIALNKSLSEALERLSVLTNKSIVISDLRKFKNNINVASVEVSKIETWLEKFRLYNLQLEDLGLTVEMALDKYNASKKENWPVVNLLANFNKVVTKGGQGFSPASDSASVMLDVKAPLYQGGRIAVNKKKNYYRYQAAKNISLQKQELLEHSIKTLHANIQSQLASYNVLMKAYAQAKRSDNILTQGASAGSVTVIELFRSREKLLNFEHQAAAKSFEYFLSNLKLKQLVGVLSYDDLKMLNKQ
jgi:outer membrane protein